MRFARFILFLLLALPVYAADRVTVSLTITNGTTNGMTFILNGSTRTFTNNVQVSSSQVLTNTTGAGTKTNLYNHVALTPFAQVSMLNGGASNISFVGASGLGMTATVGGTPSWGYVTYSTQTVATLTAVRVPVSGEATAAVRTNIGSGLVSAIEDYSTNSLNQNSTAASELVGLTNAQTVAGIKQFTNVAGHWRGQVTSTNLNGIAGSVTNGLFKTNIFAYPTTTNLVNYGAAIRSPGSGSLSEQFGTAASASGDSSVAVGNTALATNSGSVAVGYFSIAGGNPSLAVGSGAMATGSESQAVGANSVASGADSTAIGPSTTAAYDNSTAIGYSAIATSASQIRVGTANEYVSIPGNLHVIGSSTNNTMRGTNVFPSGSDISFGRYALTTLANGNNAAIPVGTNVFVQVSGPSAAFTINGIDGQPNRDGKLLIILNYTTQNMTIAHDSGTDPVAANRIYTMTGADVATTGNGSAMLIYSASASRWILINLEQ